MEISGFGNSKLWSAIRGSERDLASTTATIGLRGNPLATTVPQTWPPLPRQLPEFPVMSECLFRASPYLFPFVTQKEVLARIYVINLDRNNQYIDSI